MDAKKALGLNIARARKAAGLSQGELAEKMGTHQSVVGRWETGAVEIRGKSLRGIADALGTTVDALRGGVSPVATLPISLDGDDERYVLLRVSELMNYKADSERLRKIESALGINPDGMSTRSHPLFDHFSPASVNSGIALLTRPSLILEGEDQLTQLQGCRLRQAVAA